MKAGWQTKTLGDVLEKTETVNPLQSPETEFDYIDVSSVSNTTFQVEQTQRLKGKDAPSRARKLVKTDDVIFATIRPTLRRIAIVPPHLDKQVCSTGYFVLRPKPFLDHRFMYYWLFAEEFMGQMEALQKGASYPAVTDKEVRDQAIPFPSLPEQQRIVTLLDEAFDGIATARANAEQNLQSARALFESHLQSVFTQQGDGWISTTIGNSCILKSGTTVPVSIEKSSGDIPYVKVAEMTLPDNQDGITTSIRFLNRADVKAGWLIPAGAVIFPKRGGAILTNKKRLALVDMCADLNIMSVIPTAKLTPEFLYFYFLTVDMRKLGTGSSIPQINNYDIAPLEIAFPDSTRKQAEIADSIRSLESECQALESIYHRKIAALDDLKKSLLHQAFAGLL
jgi:type I restriction enzyme S subunit